MPNSLTIVLEWDNIQFAGQDRSDRMLATLIDQCQALHAQHPTIVHFPIELLFCHDSNLFPTQALNAALKEHLTPTSALLNWRSVPIPGARYYALKNEGARHATGDLILFLDSDVIPQPGWLHAMLAPFTDPYLQVLAGNAFIDPVSLYAKTFALAWFFPLPSHGEPLHPTTHFHANNIAFRRATFLNAPFVEIDGSSRGACIALAHRLNKNGIAIWKNPAAEVSHPAPRPGRHFLLRALAQGRDQLLIERNLRPGWRSNLLGTFARLLGHQLKAAVAIFKNSPRVGLSALQIPAALAIACTYYILFFLGEILTYLKVPAMARVRI